MLRVVAAAGALALLLTIVGCDSVSELRPVWETVDLLSGASQVTVDDSGTFFVLAFNPDRPENGAPFSLFKREKETGPWSSIAIPTDFEAYAIRTTPGGTLYTWGYDRSRTHSHDWGIIKSTDGAKSWERLPPTAAPGISDPYELSSDDNGWVVVTSTFGLLVSRDGGASWDQTWPVELPAHDQYLAGGANLCRNGVAYVNFVTIVYAPETGRYLHTSARIWATRDGGRSWRQTDLPEIRNTMYRGFTEGADGTVYLSGGESIYRTFDEGATWSILNAPPDVDEIFALAHNASGHLVAGATLRDKDYGYTFYISADGGVSWLPYDELDARTPFRSRIRYLPSGNGLHRPMPFVKRTASGRMYAFITEYSGPFGSLYRTL